MLEYLKANNKTNDVVVNGKVNNDELHRFSKSDLRWAENRYKGFQCRKVKKGKYTNLNLVKTSCRKCHMSIEGW